MQHVCFPQLLNCSYTCFTDSLCVLCAGISSLLTQHAANTLLQMYAVTLGLATVTCLRTQQPENGAAFSHAAVQSVAFLQGHGKLDRLPGSQSDILSDFVFMMLRVLTLHPSNYVKPGGYSEQAFGMAIDYCLKKQESQRPSKVITDPAAQVVRSHKSWCRELSPLLTRQDMLYVEL